MFLRVAVMILFVEFLGGLSSIPEEKLPGTSSTDVKAKERDPQLIPSDGSKKIFGGDRSDKFLYPPDSYYKQWAEEERNKDCLASNCCCYCVELYFSQQLLC